MRMLVKHGRNIKNADRDRSANALRSMKKMFDHYDIYSCPVGTGAYSSTRYLASRILTPDNCSTGIFCKSLSINTLAEELEKHYDAPYLIGKCLKGSWVRKPGDVEIRYDRDSLGVVFPDPDRDKVLRAVIGIMDDYEMEEAIIYEAAFENEPAALIYIDRKVPF